VCVVRVVRVVCRVVLTRVLVHSQVMGPLVENLESLGYTDGVNLLTAPYDWRLPYFYLEVRTTPPPHPCARDAVSRPLAFGVYAHRNATATSPGS
jgi:hypothetical protein